MKIILNYNAAEELYGIQGTCMGDFISTAIIERISGTSRNDAEYKIDEFIALYSDELDTGAERFEEQAMEVLDHVYTSMPLLTAAYYEMEEEIHSRVDGDFCNILTRVKVIDPESIEISMEVGPCV